MYRGCCLGGCAGNAKEKRPAHPRGPELLRVGDGLSRKWIELITAALDADRDKPAHSLAAGTSHGLRNAIKEIKRFAGELHAGGVEFGHWISRVGPQCAAMFPLCPYNRWAQQIHYSTIQEFSALMGHSMRNVSLMRSRHPPGIQLSALPLRRHVAPVQARATVY